MTVNMVFICYFCGRAPTFQHKSSTPSTTDVSALVEKCKRAVAGAAPVDSASSTPSPAAAPTEAAGVDEPAAAPIAAPVDFVDEEDEENGTEDDSPTDAAAGAVADACPETTIVGSTRTRRRAEVGVRMVESRCSWRFSQVWWKLLAPV